MEIAVAILIILGVIVVAALVFAGWLIVAVMRLIGRAMGMGNENSRQNSAPRPAATPPPQRRVKCAHSRCRADNPESAHFCRRCGKVIRLPQAPAPAVARRVAMW